MLDFRKSLINGTVNKVLKRLHYPLEVMVTCVRWYVAYPLSLRHVEELVHERGVFVDHSTVHRWAIKMLPVLAAVFRKRKCPVGSSWRMDETYIKVAGHWKYLYRAVGRAGDTVDFLLTAKRDKAAARRFLERTINLHDVPEKITIDKSGANTAAIESIKADACVDMILPLFSILLKPRIMRTSCLAAGPLSRRDSHASVTRKPVFFNHARRRDTKTTH